MPEVLISNNRICFSCGTKKECGKVWWYGWKDCCAKCGYDINYNIDIKMECDSN